MAESGTKASQYDKITVLSSRDAVRKRPGMYVGSSDSLGLHHLLWEILDNSIDEAMGSHASLVTVTLDPDTNRVTVEDDGRGIPIGVEESTGRPSAELVFTTLHAGAKFDNTAYKRSGGLHGVGASVTNFLSRELQCTIWRSSKEWQITFESGYLQNELQSKGTCPKAKTGTRISFIPDPEIFGADTRFDPKVVSDTLEVKTFVNAGLRIVFVNSLTGDIRDFHHPRGVLELAERYAQGQNLVHSPLIRLASEDHDWLQYEIVVGWTTNHQSFCKSFINSIPTPDHGTHVQGTRLGLARALRDFLGEAEYRDLKIRPEDVTEGLIWIVTVFSERDLQFQSQNKVKLNTAAIKEVLERDVRAKMSAYLFANPVTAGKIIGRVTLAAKARLASRSVAKPKNPKRANIRKLLLPGKLTDCASNNPKITEIFLVEGDSAGGNAKSGRDRHFQAILPLRGKVLNVEVAQEASVLANKEISGIIEALGCGHGRNLDLNKLRYGKVILLMDADSDGHHITTLLLTFFWRYMPDLIRKGHLYVAVPPLFRVMYRKERFYVASVAEKDALVTKLGPTTIVSRFKGLGEMMADTLAQTSLNPKTRTIIQISEDVDTDETIANLMGRDAKPRYDMVMSTLMS